MNLKSIHKCEGQCLDGSDTLGYGESSQLAKSLSGHGVQPSGADDVPLATVAAGVGECDAAGTWVMV